MSSELRWILFIIGVVFIVGLALWERRRPRQANSAPERAAPREASGHPGPRPLRDSALVLPEMRAREPLSSSAQELPVVELADPERVPVLEAPAAAPEAEHAREAAAESANDTLPDPLAADDAVADALASAAPPGAAEDFAYLPKAAPAPAAPTPRAPPAVPVVPAAVREVLPELPAAAAPVVEWPPDEQRRIVALRLVAPQRSASRGARCVRRWRGRLRARALCDLPQTRRSAPRGVGSASLNRPGTFDADTMDSQHYGGLSLFAVLPGPKPRRRRSMNWCSPRAA
jgi:FtsZ-interacting cell division protein ZipA